MSSQILVNNKPDELLQFHHDSAWKLSSNSWPVYQAVTYTD